MARTLGELVEWFDSYEQASMDARQESERDRAYYDGKQWTSEEEAVLRKRGQPLLTFNRIASKVDFVVGTEIQNRTDPKAYPRTPNEEEAADVATEAIRYVCDANNWDQERSAVYQDMLIEGTGAVEVRVEWRSGNIFIIIERVPWDRMFWDPRSRYPDFRDAKYFGSVLWMDLEDAIDRWPEAREVLELSVMTSSSNTDTSDDRPRVGTWSESARKRKRIKICQMQYHDEGTWKYATFTKSGFIDEPADSPYHDEFGEPEPCLILQSSKVDQENSRYGIVRPLISPQDEINKRRSKSLHLLSVRQVVAERGAVKDVRQAQQELARPDGYVEVTPGSKFEIQQNVDLTTGHFRLLQDAKAEIDSIGSSASLTGRDNSDSGRELQLRQQGGYVELKLLFDQMRSWSKRVYEQVWHRVRQFWTHEIWLRVTDSDQAIKFVPMNRPVTLREALQQRGIAAEDIAQMEQDQLEQQNAQARGFMLPGTTMGPPTDFNQIVGHENHVAHLEVDIRISDAEDSVVLAQEQFQELTRMAGAGVPIPPDVLIEASMLKNKKALLERLRNGGASPEQQQAAQQEQQRAKQMQMYAAQLELEQSAAQVGKTKAETIKTLADTHLNVDSAARQAANDVVDRFGFSPELEQQHQQSFAPAQ